MLRVDRQIINICNDAGTDFLIGVDFELSIFSEHYFSGLVLAELFNDGADNNVILEAVGGLFAQRTEPARVGAGRCQNQEVVEVEALVMAAENASDWSFDALNGEGAHDGDFEDFASDIFHITNPETAVQHGFGLIKAKHIFHLYVFDEGGHRLFFHHVNTQKVVFGLYSIVL